MIRRGVRICGARCHDARGTTCRCWCGGLFHGAAGTAAREEFRAAFQVERIPTTRAKFVELTGQLDLFPDGLGVGESWRARRGEEHRR